MFRRFGLLFVRNPHLSNVQTRHFSLSNRLFNSPTKPLIPIAKWDRGRKAPGYYIGLKDGATMSDVLGEIQGCEYKIKYTPDLLKDAFTGEFDDKALGILQRSSYVRKIFEDGYATLCTK